MKMLSFDTATEACSAALLVNGEIHERFAIAPQRHAELILPMIEALLSEAGISLQQLDAIAVGQGPGSFMGVRIAIGVAQGVAFGVDVPVIPVSTLQALAQAAYQQTQHAQVIAAWDARMQAVYWGAYALGSQGVMLPIRPDTLSAPDELALPAAKDWVLAGNAWQAYRQELAPMLKSHIEITGIYPQARAIIAIAEGLYREGKVRNALEIEPIYLRDQVAHIKNP